MEAWKSIDGVLEVELTSAEPERALCAVNASGISIAKVQRKDPLTLHFQVSRKAYPSLAALCEKRGDSLRVRGRMGLYWLGKQFVNRPVLFLGCLFLLLMALYLPSRIFFVQVEGNRTVPSRRILAAAEECGIRFGTSRRKVRSEKTKNALLSEIPQLQWAGINTVGCTAVISVRERSEPEAVQPEHIVTSIVAARDGFILSGTVTRGTPMFQIGQAVTEGQTLISGYTDCERFLQAGQSEGEILAQTSRSFQAVTPAQCGQRVRTRGEERCYSVLIGKKRIKLWKDSGNLPISCGRMYEEYYLALPGGFQIPIALCVERFAVYDVEVQDVSLVEAERSLKGFAEACLKDQMVAGEIQQKRERISSGNGRFALNGEYVCTEMIGKVKREQIGDTNGENS